MDLVLPSPRHIHHFRLGQHFERTLQTWLSAVPGSELVEANLQVQAGKRTVGEFDLLVRSSEGIEHWEAAIKFYLAAHDGNTLDCFYGPNTTDRFDIKYQRLIDHQLALSDNEHAAKLLDELGIRILRRRCFMKGRLFHPWNAFQSDTVTMPASINPTHERGWWISYPDFLHEFEPRAFRYVYLPKQLWLSRLVPEDVVNPLSFFELTEFLESPGIEQATHIAVVDASGEVSRGFVVNEHWLTRINADRHG